MIFKYKYNDMLDQFKLTYQICDSSHETVITL